MVLPVALPMKGLKPSRDARLLATLVKPVDAGRGKSFVKEY
jgi:hypothetical protein